MKRLIGWSLAVGMLFASASQARADESNPKNLYDLTFSATPKVKKGKQGTLTVKITAKGEGELHGDTPLSLALEAPPQVGMPILKFGRKDAKSSETSSSFEIPFTGESKGKGDITGTVSFVVCTKTNCFPQRVNASAPVTVE